MKFLRVLLILCLFILPFISHAQNQAEPEENTFDQASLSMQQKLEQSIEELNQLRERAANEKIPLSRKLRDLENQLSDVRLEFQQTTRLLDSRTLDLSNLTTEINSRKQESSYLSNLLSEYIRNFETRLHISEIQQFRKPLEDAKLAPENTSLSEQQIYEAQAKLLSVSLDRLENALGGNQFKGSAVDSNGMVQPGVFVQVGPAVLFQSIDKQHVGSAQQRLGSLEPAVIPFNNPSDASAAISMISNSDGIFPFDPTLGNAHKVEDTEETLVEHMQKGGPVMYPIIGMFCLMLMVAVFKWFSFMLVRNPSQRRINALMDEVLKRNKESALEKVRKMGGPVGEMLQAGVEHLNEPRDLMEEVMFEKVLSTRLKLERFLPFIAICAASAPLLGLLGTVTGIINTFKLITVFGSGDVKSLSGGISEALITTEFGLIVAIPSLLIHAFLSRKAKGYINQMEKAAVALVNHAAKAEVHKADRNMKPDMDQEIGKPSTSSGLSADGNLPALGEAT